MTMLQTNMVKLPLIKPWIRLVLNQIGFRLLIGIHFWTIISVCCHSHADNYSFFSGPVNAVNQSDRFDLWLQQRQVGTILLLLSDMSNIISTTLNS